MTIDHDEMDWFGYKAVAVVRPEPEELARRRGLEFKVSHDDLDLLSESTFKGHSGNVFGLLRHQHSPTPGTELLIRARDAADAGRQLREAIEALKLSRADLVWISPELSQLLIPDVHFAATAKKVATRKPAAAFMKPMTPDAALSAVVGSKAMPRTEITKKLWAYIKRNGLQDKKNRRMINADAKLKAVFNGKTSVSMFEMTKLVSRHLKR